MQCMDINCDLGEKSINWEYSLARDIQILEHISSMNLACGFHAGDPQTMHIMVKRAIEKGVAIGAHPSYPDKERFGRVSLSMQPGEVYDLVLYQLGALQAFLQLNDQRMHHVKPHGALYNDAARERGIADAIAAAIFDFSPELTLYGLHGSELVAAGLKKGLRVASEAFADRRYDAQGRLSPRTDPDAVIHDIPAAVEQARELIVSGTVKTRDGIAISIMPDTICLHGDNPSALPLAIALKKMFAESNVRMKAV